MLDVDRIAESDSVLFERSRMLLAAELIERTTLGGLPRQADLVGLPVDRHHRPDDIRQNRGRHGTRSEVRAGAPSSTHRTTDNQLAPLDEAAALLNACCNLRPHRENAVDG